MRGKTIKVVIKLLWYGYILFSLLYGMQYYYATWFCPARVGCRGLGANLYLLDWKDGNPSIVFGTSFKGRLCYDGIPVVPDTLVSIAAEYVTDVEWRKDKVFVETNQYKRKAKGYYMIDLSFNPDTVSINTILTQYVHIFDDSSEYELKKKTN